MIHGRDIICLSTSDWDYPIGSKQQVMSRLAKSNRVLYVEYQTSWLHPLRYPALRDRWRNSSKLQQVSDGVWTYTPRMSIPFGAYFRKVNALNQAQLERELRDVMEKLGFDKPILWFYTPLSQPLVGRLEESLVVYHCIAEFPEEKPSRLRQATLTRLEEDLVRQAQVVFAIATPLMKKFVPLSENLHLLTNGVDWGLFEDFPSVPTPTEMEGITYPRVGIVGIINYTTDLALLETLARSKPGWTFVHIGTVVLPRNEAARLYSLPNWVSFGRKPQYEVPKYMKGMDVCLVPLSDTTFTRSISSLRLMEYLAAGLPTVATDLPDIKAFGDVLFCARGAEGFIQAIEDALNDGSPALVEARRSLARSSSWDSRVETVSEVLELAMNGREQFLKAV